MDMTNRAAAARARLLSSREVAVKALGAGRPCTRCVHLTQKSGFLAPYCGNPAYGRHSFDAVKGEMVQMIEVPADQARSEDGLCGPEGLLFQSRRFETVRRHAKNLDLYLGIFGLWVFSGLIFWALIVG